PKESGELLRRGCVPSDEIRGDEALDRNRRLRARLRGGDADKTSFGMDLDERHEKRALNLATSPGRPKIGWKRKIEDARRHRGDRGGEIQAERLQRRISKTHSSTRLDAVRRHRNRLPRDHLGRRPCLWAPRVRDAHGSDRTMAQTAEFEERPDSRQPN